MGVRGWQTEEGWPYPDESDDDPVDPVDLDSLADDDLLCLKVRNDHLFDRHDPLERRVVSARFGLDGTGMRSMRQLGHELHVPRGQLHSALDRGLGKLRTELR